jgi:hypothetical protein
MTAGENKQLLGMFLVVVGAVLLVDEAGLFGIYGVTVRGFYDRYWPLLFVLSGWYLRREGMGKVGRPMIFLGLGIQLIKLLGLTLGQIFWPVLIVVLGIKLLSKER